MDWPKVKGYVSVNVTLWIQYSKQKECSTNDCGKMHLWICAFFLNHFVLLPHTHPQFYQLKSS